MTSLEQKAPRLQAVRVKLDRQGNDPETRRAWGKGARVYRVTAPGFERDVRAPNKQEAIRRIREGRIWAEEP